MDVYTYSVVLVEIDADGSLAYLTNRQDSLNLNGHIYQPAPNLNFDLPEQSGDLSAEEGEIGGVPRQLNSILSNLSDSYPYNQVSIKVIEVKLDSTLAILDQWTIFSGLLYQTVRRSGYDYMSFIVKNFMYYLDKQAGMACTENCFVNFFGDNVCQATVAEYPITIDSISDDLVTISGTPSVTDFLFNKGYFKYNGTSIKIKYWESGNVFQTSEYMPASWAGKVVTIVAGCDKKLTTCRDIHNNEEHFSGWGVSMVDYNGQYEEG